MGLEGKVNMVEEKSLRRYKGKFKKYGELMWDPSHLHNKKVKVLKTHERYGELLKEGEEGIVGPVDVEASMFNLKEEVPVYFPSRKETIGVEYEKLALVQPREIKHKGHKKSKTN